LYREMCDQFQSQSARVLILTVVIVLGLVRISNALEVQFRVQNMNTFSDNINRAPVGFEVDGYLLSVEGDLSVSGDLKSGSLDFSVGGGLEILDDGEARKSDAFRMELNSMLPWSETGYLEVSIGASDEIAEPDPSDISQVRVRTKTSRAGLEIGKRPTPTFNWRTGLSGRMESRFDRDLEELRGELGFNVELDRRRSLTFDADLTRGDELFDGDSWTNSSVSVDLRKRSDPTSVRGYRLVLEGQDLEQAGGTSEWSDKVSAVVYYETEMSSGWSFTGELGVDGIKPIVDERRWDPRVEVGLSRTLDRRVQLDGSLSTFSTIQDPFEDKVAWTRESQVRAGLVWSVSRTYTVEPSAHFRFAELFGNGIPDRTDETLILRLGTSWVPARNWSIGLSANSDNRNSSQDSFDLSENRVELNLSATL
jgi:hypothetical protein